MNMIANFNQTPIFIPPEKIEIDHVSKPPHREKVQGGVCLVVGTAPCVYGDVEDALTDFPDAKICAVNEAVSLFESDFLVTCHGDKIEQFLIAHDEAWGTDLPEIHMKDISEATTKRNCYRWQIAIGAGSAPFAAAVMHLIGFDKIILCGCPMDGGGGYAMTHTHQGSDMDPRFGFVDQKHNLVRVWKDQLYSFKNDHPDIAAKICSMSGFTKQIFGGLS